MTRTNAYSLTCVAIRAMSLFGGVTIAVWMLAGMVSMLRSGTDSGSALSLVLAGMALAVLALLWTFAGNLARMTLASPNEPLFESDMEPAQWLDLAMSIIGIWYAFDALRDAANLLLRWIILSRNELLEVGMESPWGGMFEDAFAIGVQLLLAGLLLFRRDGLRRWIYRARYGYTVAQTGDGT